MLARVSAAVKAGVMPIPGGQAVAMQARRHGARAESVTRATRSTQPKSTIASSGALLPRDPDAPAFVSTVREMRERRAQWDAAMYKSAGRVASVAFVPTMGSLHDGHLALVDHAATHGGADAVAASIFVNPTQFAPGEDYDEYVERTASLRDRDVQRLIDAGVHTVFTPSPAEMYGPASGDGAARTTVSVADVHTQSAEGSARPGFFDGVATVVTSLFGVVRPTMAVFGQKDGLQSIVIRTIVRDLHQGVDIRVIPTAREADGLAMSSRNVNLTPTERKAAPAVYASLVAMDEAWAAHVAHAGGATGAAATAAGAGSAETPGATTLTASALGDVGRKVLATVADTLGPVQYVGVANAGTGAELAATDAMDPRKAYLVSVAVRTSGTRLIDNIVVGGGADSLGIARDT